MKKCSTNVLHGVRGEIAAGLAASLGPLPDNTRLVSAKARSATQMAVRASKSTLRATRPSSRTPNGAKQGWGCLWPGPLVAPSSAVARWARAARFVNMLAGFV